jgi:hypothetical protein
MGRSVFGNQRCNAPTQSNVFIVGDAEMLTGKRTG